MDGTDLIAAPHFIRFKKHERHWPPAAATPPGCIIPKIVGGHAKSIYVQIDICGPLEQVWRLTQTPELHKKWDLRFTEIEYLPRANPQDPQRFLYATRIGMGLAIRGGGETVGSRDGPDRERSSALKFWSDDPKSLIHHGSGYWKYIPYDESDEKIRFLTGYDYQVRFGIVGQLFDRAIFRPMIGWATAWSFDRLRLWVEKQIDPADAMRRSVIYVTARFALVFAWLYQGIVPKLIYQHADELKMLHAAGFSQSAGREACIAIGCAESALGLVLLFAWRSRWPLWLTIFAMPSAAAAVAIFSPEFLRAAFNPVALNICVLALAVIALLEQRDLPTARRCLRAPSVETP